MAARRWLRVKMAAHVFAENLGPAEVLDALVARHGIARVLMALPSAMMKRRAVALRGDHMSDHMLRDIGLYRGGGRKDPWEYR